MKSLAFGKHPQKRFDWGTLAKKMKDNPDISAHVANGGWVPRSQGAGTTNPNQGR